jgi:1-acyl-sn-glycerol-3-phosphate acyltransferase
MSDAARPAYEVPRLELVRFGIDLLRGRRRSFARDGALIVRANTYGRHIEGVEQVPREGPFILVMNHYSRRGLRPYHCAMVVTAALAEHRPEQPEPCWAFTSEYLGRKIGPFPIPLSFIRWLFRRVAVVYDFVIIARRQELVAGRAAALRQLARHLQHGRPVALTPEGLESSGRLVVPPPGAGLLLEALNARRAPLVPVGVWEDDGVLRVRFGAPFDLAVDRQASREEQDRASSTAAMLAIGRLLPRDWQGDYERLLTPPSSQPS